MTSALRLLLLPFRAPMLLLLLGVSLYLGQHWGLPMEQQGEAITATRSLIWSAECAQALVVVMLCCMPDLLVRRFSSLLATSRVVTLIATLLLVTVGGLYLLHLEVLSNVLILGSAVLLARLDLARIRIAPPPQLLAALLALLVVGGAGVGHWLSLHQGIGRAAPPQPPAAAARSQGQAKPSWRAPLLGRVTNPAKTQPAR
ncbi:MAG: hypothetical protein ACKOZT_11665 [Cyanobium sp.]